MNAATSPAARPRLLVTRRLPEAVLQRAASQFELTLWPHDAPMGDQLAPWATGQDALLVMANDRIDAPLLQACAPRLRAVATYSAGHDHIDVAAATAAGLPVFTTPDVLSEAVAEVAIYLTLAAARRTHRAERALREGGWGPWSPSFMVGMQLTGKRLGIYGMGAIGREIARRAQAFGLRVAYHNRSRLDAALEGGATYFDSLDTLLAHSDILCVAAPSSPATRGSLNRRTLALLPRGAIVVNIARGDLVDEDALLALLASGHIANVGLDVFRNEPNIDARWLALPDAALLPHIGSATEQAREAMGLSALSALEAHFAGGQPATCLNPSVYAPPRAADTRSPQ